MHVAYGRGSVLFYGIVLRYVLLVFWVASCFYTMRSVGQFSGGSTDWMLDNYSVWLSYHNASQGVKSALFQLWTPVYLGQVVYIFDALMTAPDY